MACWLLEFETKKLDNKAINLIENLNNFQAISYSESNNIFEYKVYLNKYVTEEIFLNLIFNNPSTENYKLKKKIKIKVSNISGIDWLHENFKLFLPVEYNDFIFYGDHFKDHIKYKKHKIRLNSSDAFGSGAHPTTEGCIKAIKFLNKKIKINSFLDIGSGSGILSICASKYWKNAQIYGVDIDKTSIIRSRKNIINNNLKSKIRFELIHPKTNLNLQYKSEFDLVVANIITSELSLLAKYIEKKIKKNGYLVLSGILDYQSKIILSKFRNFNIILNKKISISGWVTIILKKEVKHNETKYLS